MHQHTRSDTGIQKENQGLLPEDVREERQEKARKELERREVGEKGKD